jgi:hypothetical protein
MACYEERLMEKLWRFQRRALCATPTIDDLLIQAILHHVYELFVKLGDRFSRQAGNVSFASAQRGRSKNY